MQLQLRLANAPNTCRNWSEPLRQDAAFMNASKR